MNKEMCCAVMKCVFVEFKALLKDHYSQIQKKMRNNNDADSSINLLKKQETKPKGNASKMLVKATCLGEKLKNRVGELSELPFYNIDDIADVFGIQHNGDQKPKCRRRRHRRRGKETCSEREKEMKPRIQRPNYFVAIPVTNKRILEKIGKIQNAMISKEKMLRSAVIPLEKMHLTVIVANLKNEDMIKRAADALQQCRKKLDEILQGRWPQMAFCGIDQFDNKVVYIKMTEVEQPILCHMAEIIRQHFEDMGLDITGSKEFKPHLTILKLSRAPALRRMRLKAIIYKEYEDFSFGVQTFTRIDLCAMRKTQASGYYQCESSLVWGSSEASVGELTSCSEVTMVTSESVACVGETQDCSSDQDQPLSSLRVTSCAEQDSVHGSVLKETVNSRHASAADLGRDIDDKVHGESTGISTKPEDLERACAKTTD